MRTFILCFLLVAVLPCAAADSNALLWQEPGKITVADWIWGPGGEARAPQGPFTFLEEDLNGTNPKLKVRDAKGDHWIVKFGGEDHSEVFAARLLFAMGYAAQPSYFVRSGVITGVHGLKRAKPFIGKQGEFAYARFKLPQSKKVTRVERLDWSWTSNPFVATHQLNGLKILMMLVSNWDAKDSRDGKGSNTAVYSRPGPGGDRLFYAFDDWGATLGRWGGFFSRDKWNARGFSQQTRTFVSRGDGESIRWGYRGKHGRDVTSGIRIEDVRWLLTNLSGASDEELSAGLQASGATPGEIDTYARSIRERIVQLQRLCEGAVSTH
ncbi:MAG: hypothetical protein LAQ69_28760 [Acidobacteriia bacterium]|nr:hypothetical protein [Terriglobia bacterium]